jgi:hypothetical protein
VLRNLVVLVLSVVVGAIVISVVQSVNWMLFPPPAGFDFSDPVAVERMVANMPFGAWVGLELSYALGCLSCGLLIGAFAASRPLLLAAIAGVVFTLAGFANMAMIPTPLVMAILTTVTYLPCTLLGAWLMARRRGGFTAGR